MQSLLWIVTAASLIATVANIYKKRWCFIIWFMSNIVWAVTDFYYGIYSQAALMLIYTVLAVWGWYKWEEKNAEKHSGDNRCDI